jgi:hypothetical protein
MGSAKCFLWFSYATKTISTQKNTARKCVRKRSKIANQDNNNIIIVVVVLHRKDMTPPHTC